MQEHYATVAAEGVHETEVKRSRFLCALAPVATEDEARTFVARVRAAHPSAAHNCFAYVIGAEGGVRRADDDGEPGGTAGRPMLQMLLRRDVRCTAAVVTRYFGGTKLGAGGLIRAYGGAVGEALDVLGTVVRRQVRRVTITVEPRRAGKLENELRALGRDVLEVRYGGDRVTLAVGVPVAEMEPFRAWLAAATAGAALLEADEETYGGP